MKNTSCKTAARVAISIASYSFLAAAPLGAADRATPAPPRSVNPLIDFATFREIAQQVQPIREKRRLSEEAFEIMAAEPGTIVLDARSADKYALRHIRGAINLPFTDFTAASLAEKIHTPETKVLIYCNNNFLGAPISLASKSAPASLNISTYIALATYGYKNVYELAPLLDVKKTKLAFEGSEVTQPAQP